MLFRSSPGGSEADGESYGGVDDPMPAMDENVIKRIMPHSLEAEQSVIGSMFIDAEAIAAATEQISGEDFYNRQYGVVFDTIVELNNEGKPIDFVTLQDRLRSKEDVPPEVSGLDFLTNLIAAVPTSANIKYYAGIVAEKATLRRLIRTNEEIANTCYSGKESLDTIDRKSTRLNSSHANESRMPSSA